MATVKKSTVKRSAKKDSAKKSAAEGNHCWPGFQPTLGKQAGAKGSCKPVPGTHSKATKRATQKTAAAAKLQKQGKPDPKSRK